uniref:WAT1-related protein n=1 Tax=Leersia perrieri TaxID=77586 RepID=A0A0D9WZN9_9ORYZ
MGYGGVKSYAAVFLIRIMYSIMQVLNKVSLDQGMSPLVFIFYRNTTAALVLIPVAFILERGKAKTLTLRNSGKMFIHALYGVTACGVFFNLGLNYASATSSSALYNVQPVVTFILAVLFGLESMKLKRFHGNLKAAGILFCMGGVIILAFFEGPKFKSFNHHRLFKQVSSNSPTGNNHSKKQWALGIFLMILSNILGGLWNVFQGVIVAALSYYMQIWTIEKRGPVFLAMSMPLTLIFTIIISSFILGDAVSLGSILAGILLIGGLFNVLWGKNIEERDELTNIYPANPDLEMQDKEGQVPDDGVTKD